MNPVSKRILDVVMQCYAMLCILWFPSAETLGQHQHDRQIPTLTETNRNWSV